MANPKLPRTMVLDGLNVNLNHLIILSNIRLSDTVLYYVIPSYPV